MKLIKTVALCGLVCLGHAEDKESDKMTRQAYRETLIKSKKDIEKRLENPTKLPKHETLAGLHKVLLEINQELYKFDSEKIVRNALGG